MKTLSGVARIYIFGMIAAGVEALAYFGQHWALAPERLWLAAAICAGAAAAQILNVEGATRKSSYNLSLVAYALALVLFGPSVAAAIIMVACLADWAWHRYPWYIQTFNMGALLVALLGATLASQAVASVGPAGGAYAFAGVVTLVATFVLLNHLFVGIVIYLARGESFRESGVFDAMELGMDASLFGLGATGAFIWAVNPFASLLVVPPLVLLYFSLRVPMLERQAASDPKTGLYNARYFNDALKRELDRSDRYDRPLTVVMGDLDLLRNINNRYGHVAGDIVLKGVAELLRDSVRDYDVVSRFGGEEFAVLMGETSMQDAEAKLETIRAAVEAAEFHVPTSVEPIRVTMSFGVAERCAGMTMLDIVHMADLALYQAKLEGRNRVRFAEKRSAKTAAALAAVKQVAAGATTPVEIPVEPAVPTTAVPLPETSLAASAAAVTSQVATPRPEPEPQSETAEERQVLPQPMWVSEAFIVAVAIIAAAMLVFSGGINFAGTPWVSVAVFSVLVFGAELLSIEIHSREASVSASVVPFIAGALLFGAPAVAALSVAAATGKFIRHHGQASRFVLDTSTSVIAGFVAIGAARLAVPASAPTISATVFSAAVASVAVYLVTTGLGSLAIALTTNERPEKVWFARFRYVAPNYLGLSLVAGAAMLGYAEAGLVGSVLLMSPLLVLRFGQEQHFDHVKEMVSQLRSTNAELEDRTNRIENLNQELLFALTNMVELRDPYMLGHSQHVAKYADRIAERMGLSGEARERVMKAGLLHDIGKLGIPEAVLQKASLLDEEERQVVQRHCGIGSDIVTNCSSLRSVVAAVRHHHERYDGAGYPDGLRGEQIPIEARILAVADAVEAMASDRPYREGMGTTHIVDELQAGAGKQFDPTVARVFCELVAEEGQDMIVNSALKVAQAAAEAIDPARLVPQSMTGSLDARQAS